MRVDSDRGAEWRKWDLHVHTPCSLRQNYGGDSDQAWDRYLTELENLPPEFSVIGINDYWFLDGYRKVLEARKAGRLKNLQAIFPVLELRLDQFGGTDSHLSKANLHIIFDPELDPEVIQEQFINAMTCRFTLSPGADNWTGLITRQSLSDLGASIKTSMPPGMAHTLGSDIKAGFDNLVVPIEPVRQALKAKYFRNRAILALGKTEWAAIRWQHGSIASKKSLINEVELLFTAFEDASAHPAQQRALRAACVNHRLIDCSDAHNWSTDPVKDRIGNCATWVKAAPSFGGLLHALTEFDSRVYVGTEPPDYSRLQTSPERTIDKVTIRPRSSGKSTQFNYHVTLNPGLVAVIGNKGQGKSALLDCIARSGNSSRDKDFAFLNKQRFLNPRSGHGQEYEVSVVWRNGRERVASLADGYEPASLEDVEYLPQALIERICSSDPTSEHRGSFEDELKRVIFHHIQRAEREGQVDLDTLLMLRTKPLTSSITALREEIHTEVARFIALQKKSRNLVADNLRSRLETLYSSRQTIERELEETSAALQAASRTPVQHDPGLLEDRKTIAELDVQLAHAREQDQSDLAVAADVQRRISELESAVAEIEILRSRAQELNERVSRILDEDDAYVSFLVNDARIMELRQALNTEREHRQASVSSRTVEAAKLEVARENIAKRLEIADTARERERRQLEQLNERLRQLTGRDDDPDTIAGIEYLLQAAEQLPAEIEDSQAKILTACHSIHELILSQLQVIQQLYQPAAEFVANEPLAQEASLHFEAELEISSSWDSLAGSLDGRRTSELQDYLTSQREAIKPESVEEITDLIRNVLNRLPRDRGSDTGRARSIDAAVRGNADVSQIVSDFSSLKWLEPRFGLTGAGMPLSQLSPGQRGLILLLFYLLVDRSESPLLIDQPEENLDNDAVQRLLVPALKKARLRRQIVIVTHSANLAVVGDADQIISCSHRNDVFAVRSGSLAGRETGKTAIDVLEGSRGAFDNRRQKYDKIVALD